MRPALIKYFKSMTRTNWTLSDSNLKYIGSKIFQTSSSPDSSLLNLYVSRKCFCEKHNATKVGLWEWFYAIIELINKHLENFWENG